MPKAPARLWITRLCLGTAVLLACAWLDAAPIPLGTGVEPHPAVCRIIVPQSDGTAYGSGTLVDVKGTHGLVVTNLHVVRDATGEIVVVFPNGFRSAARVVKQDRDWDLAAVMIWAPKDIKPVAIASQAPRPGHRLTIAGYGSGTYRAAEGRCTQYVSPGMHLPFEMVELSASARNGDSGGPILNEQGELAGVLFGTGRGRTSGSYSARVGRFLATVVPDIMDSRRPRPPTKPTPSVTAGEQLVAVPPRRKDSGRQSSAPAEASQPARPKPSFTANQNPVPSDRSSTESGSRAPSESADDQAITWNDFAGDTVGSQAKTVLALIGALAVLINIAKFVGRES